MKKRGVITLVFDDGYERVYRNALPALDTHKIPGVFALAINGEKLAKTEQRAVKPWDEWVPIRKKGHEIASHTLTHPDLTSISDEKLQTELATSARKLEATTIVYPGGAVDERVVNAASKTYTAGRTVKAGFETLPPENPMLLKSYNYSRNNFSILKANILVLWAYITNSWLIETYHMIDDNDRELLHTVKTRDLKRHLTFISRLPVATKTIQEVLS